MKVGWKVVKSSFKTASSDDRALTTLSTLVANTNQSEQDAEIGNTDEGKGLYPSPMRWLTSGYDKLFKCNGKW